MRTAPAPALTLAACLASVLACTMPNPEYGIGQPLDAAASDVGSRDGSDASRDGSSAAPDGVSYSLTSHLIGYWKLDEAPGATMAADSSGHGHHGILENLDEDSVWVGGYHGGAIEIPGNDHAAGVRVPLTPEIAGLQRFTVAAWAYRRTVGTDYASVISRQLGATQYEVFNLSFTGSLISIYLPAGTPSSAHPFVTRSKRATPGATWIHVAATFDGSTVRLYLDGVEENTMSYPRPIAPSNQPLYLGTNQNDSDGEPMVGRLDDILLYSEALPRNAIAALAAGALPPGL
jgi:hypothetical protein